MKRWDQILDGRVEHIQRGKKNNNAGSKAQQRFHLVFWIPITHHPHCSSGGLKTHRDVTVLPPRLVTQ